jgi:hypothetical protein
MNFRQYLGDGVYINYDGYHVILTTEDGISTTNTIYLDPEVVMSVSHYFKQLVEHFESLRKENSNEKVIKIEASVDDVVEIHWVESGEKPVVDRRTPPKPSKTTFRATKNPE